MIGDLKITAVTFVAAFTGAALAALMGIPAGALIGSTVAVVIAAAFGRAVEVPLASRNLAFAVIGVSLGAGIDQRFFVQIDLWAVSLAILVLSLIATIAIGRVVLIKVFGMDPSTATLSSSPGTMSNAIAIATDGRGDPAAVMFIQLMRLLILVIAVPPIAASLDSVPVVAAESSREMPLFIFCILIGIAVLLGPIGKHFRVPAATLVIGMVVSGLVHAAGLVSGIAPTWAVFVAFVFTGAVLGSRMQAVEGDQVRRHAFAGILIVIIAIVLSLGFAFIAMMATGIQFAQVWIAFAPGAVEAMAAIGLSLGYDPAFVAVHHFIRIFALALILPLALRM